MKGLPNSVVPSKVTISSAFTCAAKYVSRTNQCAESALIPEILPVRKGTHANSC